MREQQITPAVHQDALAIARQTRKELKQLYPELAPCMFRTWTDKRAYGVRSKVGMVRTEQHLGTTEQFEMYRWQLEQWGKKWNRQIAPAGWQIRVSLIRCEWYRAIAIHVTNTH